MNAQIACPSKISHVTVHARGALVRRQVTVPESLPAGDVELLIDDITPLAEPGSVRAAAPAGSRPIIAVQSALIVPATAIAVGPSAARVHELEGRKSRLVLEIERLQGQRQSLAALQPDPGLRTTSLIEKVDERVADALATAQLLGTIQGELDARLQELHSQQVQVHRELEAARLGQAQASTDTRADGERQQRRVTVRLGSGGPLPQLELLYVVPAARFWPLYTLRITEGGRKASWLIEALCAQRSGEDFVEVRLGLSTADLIYDARLPELPSLRLGRAQPPTRRGYRPPPEGLERMFSGYDRAFGSAPPPAEPLPPEPEPEPELILAESAAEFADSDDEESADGAAPARYSSPPPKGRAGRAEAKKSSPERNQAWPEAPAASRQAPSARPSSFLAAAPPPSRAASGYGGPPGMAPQSLQGTRGGPPLEARARRVATLGGAMPEGGFGGGGGEQDEYAPVPEPPSPSQEPQDAWLDFDHLSMAGPSDGQRRGRLTYSGEGDSALRQRAIAQLESLMPSDRLTDPQGSRGRFDHRYDAEGLVRIPSDGQPHRVALLCAETVPTLRMLTVPGERPEVYREAELQNPCEAPLLSGPVDVYVEGSLLTTASIDHIDRGGTLRVGMGVEDRLRVARNVRSDEDTAGLLGGSMVVTHTVTIELSSALGQPSTVEVLERLPVSEDKSMTVELLAVRPEASPYTQAERGAPIRGGLQWRIQLAAAGKAKIEYQYRITFPARTEIVGGNRRD